MENQFLRAAWKPLGVVWCARRAHGQVALRAYWDQSVPRRANPYQCKANRLENAMYRRLCQEFAEALQGGGPQERPHVQQFSVRRFDADVLSATRFTQSPRKVYTKTSLGEKRKPMTIIGIGLAKQFH